MFEGVLGHALVKAYLQKALQKQSLPHALLFFGPDGVGKALVAKTLATRLLETPLSRIEAELHPDLHVLRPEGKIGLHSMEAVLHCIEEVYRAPFQAKRKVFLFYEAERMQGPAANALLKTVEEPAPDTTLLFLTASSCDMLPALASRCTGLAFHPLQEEEIASWLVANGKESHWAKCAEGSLGQALEMATTAASWEKRLIPLLAERFPYPELSLALEGIEKELDSENPVRRSHQIERLLLGLLQWARDQQARRLDVREELLFFPEEAGSSSLSVEELQKSIEQVREGLSRNMKFSTCLENLFLAF